MGNTNFSEDAPKLPDIKKLKEKYSPVKRIPPGIGKKSVEKNAESFRQFDIGAMRISPVRNGAIEGRRGRAGEDSHSGSSRGSEGDHTEGSVSRSGLSPIRRDGSPIRRNGSPVRGNESGQRGKRRLADSPDRNGGMGKQKHVSFERRVEYDSADSSGVLNDTNSVEPGKDKDHAQDLKTCIRYLHSISERLQRLEKNQEVILAKIDDAHR